LLFEHDLFRPAFARRSSTERGRKELDGIAQAGNRYPLCGIMLSLIALLPRARAPKCLLDGKGRHQFCLMGVIGTAVGTE
jgi:hypothetical protein